MSNFTWYREDGATIICLETAAIYFKDEETSEVWNKLLSLCDGEVEPAEKGWKQGGIDWFRLKESEELRKQALRANAEMMEDLDRARHERDEANNRLRAEVGLRQEFEQSLNEAKARISDLKKRAITWHNYPEVVPAACLGPITMLVAMKLGVYPAVWNPRREVFLKYRPCSLEEELVGVIAWAHLPAVYNPKEEHHE